MIAMKFCWLILEGIFVLFFLYFGSSTAFALALLLLLLPPVNALINLFVKKKIKVSLNSEPNLRKGESGEVEIVIKNNSVFPVFHMGIKLLAENQLNGQKSEHNVSTWLPSKGKQTETINTGSDYCGRIKVSVKRARIYDCFGIIGIGFKCNAKAHVTVQPDTFETIINLSPNSRAFDESDIYSQEKAGDDLTEIYQIREYVPGDSPRQVHWKLSNKFGKLIVKEPALPITRNVLVFWERTGESGNLDIIDAQAEAIVSVCKSLLDQSIQFTIGWNDTDRNICILHEVSDMDKFIGVITRIMRATGTKEGVSGAGLLVQTRPEAFCAHMIYIAEEPQSEVTAMQGEGNVSMLLCGKTPLDGALMFDSEHYEQQLSQIDL